MEHQIKIGIVDDHKNILEGLELKFGLFDHIKVVFAENKSESLVKNLQNAPELPDVIFMDIEMPGMNGIECTKAVKSEFPEIKIIMLTVFDNDDHIFNAILSGATGYILKDEPIQRIIQSLEDVYHGGASMSASIASKILHLLHHKKAEKKIPEEHELTSREIEILELLVKPKKRTEVALELNISEFTVKKHIENIYKKLQINSRMELYDWYKKNN